MGLTQVFRNFFTMVKYARDPENAVKSCKARGSDLRCHFKNTREAAMALKRMSLRRAQAYLSAVLDHKEVIPFRRFCGGVGRTAQAKNHRHTQGRWPEKSVKYLIGLLQNAESNAEAKMRRRTYRAHGRINAYMSSPSHIEVILTEKEKAVKKAAAAPKSVKKISKKKLAKERLRAGPRVIGD